MRAVALEATLGMAFAADGRLDGCHEAHINAWDVAAGLALVAEAGGWCSDFILAATPVVVAPRVYAPYVYSPYANAYSPYVYGPYARSWYGDSYDYNDGGYPRRFRRGWW